MVDAARGALRPRGLLAQLRPALAIEVGTYEGGSLRRIARHAGEVHAFDIDPRTVAFVLTPDLHRAFRAKRRRRRFGALG